LAKRAQQKSAARPGRNPQLSRRRILEAALHEFATHGFAGARVDVIARAARINKRMLYHYFGDKEALFREVLRRKISERKAFVAQAPENPFESLPLWSELMATDAEWIRLLQWEALHWGGRRKVIDEQRRRESLERTVGKLKLQQARGVLPRELDAGQLLISMIALTAYPFAFPQLARLATGMNVLSSAFQKQRAEFLRRLGARLQTNKKENR
jgi:AcrR family transcriptional regulator